MNDYDAYTEELFQLGHYKVNSYFKRNSDPLKPEWDKVLEHLNLTTQQHH